MADSLIRLEGIKKVFYTDEVETHALSEIHLDIRHGEYVAIAGPSGCGKTTLLSILGLLDSPTEGSYTLDGQPVARLTASPLVESRLPVGSSASRIAGSPATARATATRCCWPPESWAGKCFIRCDIPTRSRADWTRLRRSSAGMPR